MIHNFKFRQFVFKLLTPMVKFNDWLIDNIGLYNGVKRLKRLSEKHTDKLITDKILSGKPFAIGRYGHTEFCSIMRIGNYKYHKKLLNIGGIHANIYDQWEKLYWESSKDLDIISVWNYRTNYIAKINFMKKVPNVEYLIPLQFWDPLRERKWLQALKNKKLLVVNPFVKTIKLQYSKREEIGILPELKSLELVKSVVSLMEIGEEFDWFGALESMKREIATRDFDIAFIGCATYGLPLATYIKQLGKQAIVLGGVTQLYFGIKGSRWYNDPEFKKAVNEHWISILDEEIHPKFREIENGCYIG